MKKIFLSFIAMVLCTIAINAKGTIGLSSLSFSPGETKVLSIELNDETAYTAFQMDLALPAGFSIATTTNEDDEEVLDITIDASRKKSTHQLSYNKIGEGVYRIAAFSSTNATFKGTSGAIVNVAVTAGEDIAAGDYTIELKNVAFTTPEPVDVKFDDITASFEVIGNEPPAAGIISMEPLTFSPGGTKVLSIELNDETAYTAFQMDLALPAGFSIATTTNEDDEEVLDITIDASRKKSTHQLSYNKIGEGVYRIAAFSSTNATFKGTSGAIVNVAITAGIGISAGSYTVELKNVAFTTPEPKDVKFNDVTTSLEVIKSTPITSYTASVNCGPEGTAMLSAYVVTSGSPLKLLIAPNDGYKVSSLLLNGNKVNVKNNIYNIAYVTENVVFDVAFAQVKPDTVEVEKIVTDTIEVEKIITDSIFVEVTDTLVVEKIVTDTIEIETIEIDTIYLAEINNIPTPEITFANGMMSISCALQGAKIFYSTDGTLPTQEYSVPVAIEEDCVVMAIAVVASETASMEIIGTGIGGGSMINEIVSCRYFTEAGVEIDEPREGINIMIIEYANGKTETKKVVVRKK